MHQISSESAEEGKANRWAKLHGIIPIKLNLQGNRGWPDRLYIYPEGFTLWVEYKRKGKEAEPLQKYRITQLRKKGHHAFVVDSSADAVTLLEAASVYVSSSQVRCVAGLCRIPFRPRIGKDFNHLNDF
jgi:hypothetical protein